MENKKYLNEEKYQKAEKTITLIAVLVLVVGLCVGGLLIFKGVAKPNTSKVEDLKVELETKRSELEAKLNESLTAEKQKLETKKNELTSKGIKYDAFAKYDDGETYDLKIITEALDPSFDNCAFDEYKNNSLTKDYCALSNGTSENSKNLEVINDALDDSFDHCAFSECKNNSFTKEYCAAKNSIGDFASTGSKMIGIFICIASCMISFAIFMFAKRRQVLAFSAQQVMPVGKEVIDEMAPTVGNAVGEIAKGIKKGLKDDDEK